jgi:hypothetical protein
VALFTSFLILIVSATVLKRVRKESNEEFVYLLLLNLSRLTTDWRKDLILYWGIGGPKFESKERDEPEKPMKYRKPRRIKVIRIQIRYLFLPPDFSYRFIMSLRS